jgi:hypothetical protein
LFPGVAACETAGNRGVGGRAERDRSRKENSGWNRQ